jgi:hypothetical protein
MFHINAKNRWHAFGIHLLISLALFIAMCIIIVVFWYPGILFTTEGGWQGVRLIAGIDFIIGPVLTLLVYKVGKPSLKFDLTCIGILQVICITYGMYVVHYSRPAVVAYADGIFYTTPLLRFDSRGIDISQNELLKGKMPVWVNIQLPDNEEEKLKIKIERLWQGLETSVDLYEPYENALRVLPTEGFSLTEGKSAGLSIPESLREDHTRIFRLNTRYNTYAVAVDIRTGKFVELLGIVQFAGVDLIPAKSD